MSQQVPSQGGVSTHPQATTGGQVILPPDGQTAGYPAAGQSFPQPQGPSVQQVVVQQIRTPETKEFFKTSEFLVWALGVAGLLIASGMIDDALDAPLVWRLITFLSSGYILSRGLAKAAARRGVEDIRRDYNQTPAGGYGEGASVSDRAGDFAQRHIATPETKEFFKTSEFLAWVLTVAGIFIAAGSVDVYDAGQAWTHATWVSIAYIVSRGISKMGTRRDDGAQGHLGY